MIRRRYTLFASKRGFLSSRDRGELAVSIEVSGSEGRVWFDLVGFFWLWIWDFIGVWILF